MFKKIKEIIKNHKLINSFVKEKNNEELDRILKE